MKMIARDVKKNSDVCFYLFLMLQHQLKYTCGEGPLHPLTYNQTTNGLVNFHLIFRPGISKNHTKSNRKAMKRNWSNQKANPALKTKTGNK